MKMVSPALKKSASWFLIFVMMFYTTSCNYYKVKKLSKSDSAGMQHIGSMHQKIILHAGDETFVMTNIKVDSTFLSGYIFKTDSTDFFYNEKNTDKTYKISQKEILNEVHIYLNEWQVKSMHAEIPLENIQEIRIIDPDTGLTVASYVISTIAIIGGVMAIVYILIILLKSSCPYVYVHDGNTYVFAGEIYGGAVAKNLERDDYMPLPDIKWQNGRFKLRISNELKEVQYTDLAELLVVNHPENSEVLLDNSGQPRLIRKKQAPTVALSGGGEDLLSTLEKRDNHIYFFNDHHSSNHAVLLKFDKPNDVKTANFVFRAKNTLWFDYIFGDFLSMFGRKYKRWMEKQSALPREERMQKIREYKFPLFVYVKKDNRWVLQEEILTVGPLAYRDFVVPIDVSSISDKQIEIKVETGFMFWEMDAVFMDFTGNEQVSYDVVKPNVVFGTGGINWLDSLMKDDNQYMIQHNEGDVSELLFITDPPEPGYKQSVFLHTQGYYTLVRDFQGPPDVSGLKKFKAPDHFSSFSKSKYLELMNHNKSQKVNPPKSK